VRLGKRKSGTGERADGGLGGGDDVARVEKYFRNLMVAAECAVVARRKDPVAQEFVDGLHALARAERLSPVQREACREEFGGDDLRGVFERNLRAAMGAMLT
jgi:hypothetical protein